MASRTRQEQEKLLLQGQEAGFKFDNYQRNAELESQGIKGPSHTSTGTTIVGCLYKGGVVLAADTRATQGPIVADKNCRKLHRISPNIWCAGAGTAADTDFVTNLVSSNVELHAMYTGRKPRVVTALTMLKQHLFQYQGHVGAYLVVGGVDPTGSHLYTVAAHGSTDSLPYVTMGSGSLAAMSVFETKWHENMTRDEAIGLAQMAIEAGIFNDLGSGSNVDVVYIEADTARNLRGYAKPNERAPKEQSYKFPRGTTGIIREDIRKFVDIVSVSSSTAMEVDS